MSAAVSPLLALIRCRGIEADCLRSQTRHMRGYLKVLHALSRWSHLAEAGLPRLRPPARFSQTCRLEGEALVVRGRNFGHYDGVRVCVKAPALRGKQIQLVSLGYCW